jgi:hypothetical protein
VNTARQVLSKLMKCYEEDPYPSEDRLAQIATEIAAPGVSQVGPINRVTLVLPIYSS